MESHLKLFLPLSLKELVLRKVAGLFSNDSYILDFFYGSVHDRLTACEIKNWLEATEEEILKVGLPDSLNNQVIERIQDIGFEIKRWKKRNEIVWFGLEAEMELPDVSQLCWSSTGTIDYRKIAEQYVLGDRLTVWQCYEIACHNCLEDNIPLLYDKLSEAEKRKYRFNLRFPSLERCWPYILEGEQSRLDCLWRKSDQNLTSFNQWAFEHTAGNGNQVGVEYFFQRLTPEEREVSLMRTAYNVTYGNVLFYLLSVMTPEQQMEIVKARPVEVLLCFLDWKRQHLLSENAGLIWAHLPESDYGIMLERIEYTLELEELCVPKLLQAFFRHAPLDFIKKSFVGHESNFSPPACDILCALVNIGDSESIEVLFRHADPASRLKLILCDRVFCRFIDCILEEKWYGVEVCLQGAALSHEEKSSLKESFTQFLFEQDLDVVYEEQKLGRFFEILDETDARDDQEKKA